MSDIEYNTEIDISATDSEQQRDSEIQEDTELMEAEDSESNTLETATHSEKKSPPPRIESIKSTRLPMARIKNIMKMDPDVHLINHDALFLVTKATELFLETIAKETYTYTANKKKKTITKKDLDYVVNLVDCLCFLEGAMDF